MQYELRERRKEYCEKISKEFDEKSWFIKSRYKAARSLFKFHKTPNFINGVMRLYPN